MNQNNDTQWTTGRIDRAAVRLFLLCFLSYTFCYIGRHNFSACLPAMIADGTLTKPFGGYITTAYMIVYGSGQLVSGILGTKIRPQTMIGCGLLGAGVMNVVMGLCRDPVPMLLVWSLNGLFQSMLWAPIIRVFTDQLPEERRYRAGVDIAVTCPAGTVLAYLIPALFLKIADWRVVFFVSGGCVLLACGIWVVGNFSLKEYLALMDERCRQARAALAADAGSDKSPAGQTTLFSVILPSGLLLVMLCLICNGSLRDAVSSWAPTFFSEQFGMAPEKSAVLSVVIPVVSVSGAYVATWLDRRFLHNELFTSGAMFLTAAVCILGIRLFSERSPLLCAVCLAVSISSMWGANTMFLTMLPYHFAGLGLSASVTGLLNCCIYFASAASTSLYGLASERAGWTALTLIWLAVSLAGIVFCVVFGFIWARKAKLLDENRLMKPTRD